MAETRNTWQTIKRFSVYVLDLKTTLGFGVLAMLGYGMVDATLLNILQPLVDEGFTEETTTFLKWMPLFVVGMITIRGLCAFGSTYCMARTGNTVVMRLQCQLFDHLMHLPVSFFDKTPSGELVSKIIYDSTQVSGAASKSLVNIFRSGAFIIGLLIWMFYQSWELSLVLLFVAPAVGLIVNVVSKRFRMISRRLQKAMGNVSTTAQQMLHGQKDVLMFAGHETERERFATVSNNIRQQQMKMSTTRAASNAIVQIVASFALAVVLYLASVDSIRDQLTPGKFVAIVGSMLALLRPLRDITNINSEIQKAIAACNSLFDILDLEVEKNTGSYVTDKVKGKINFDGINFTYPTANERLINKLDKVYSENNIAIDDLLEIFFIFSFWIKKSGVSKNTFSKIGSNIGMYYDSGRDRSEITNIIEKSDLEILEEKIENLHFKDFIFSNNLWKEILFEGYIDEQKINLELSKSNLFSKESSKPSWYKLWHYRDLSESEIIHHFDILEKQFSEHKFIDINEIMHVIGLRLHFTSLGQYPENLEEIIQQCKVYIDHLYATNKLEPFLGSNNSENTYINDTGLSYFNSGKDEFKEIYDYLHKHRDLATKDKLDEYAEEVLQALKTDDKKFFSLICWTNDENENPFQNIPVMTKIAPKEYVSIALSKTDQTYKTAIIMFNERYDSHNIINNLKEEIDWIIAVKDELIKQSKNKTPIFKSIIETLIEVHIDPIINEHDQNKTNKSNLS